MVKGAGSRRAQGEARAGRRTSSTKGGNRRLRGDKSARASKTPLEPEQRRIRNRTILALAVLALINAYVFVWNEDGLFSGLGSLEAASTAERHGPLPAMAEPPQTACGGDPVRIFAGLEDLIHLETRLGGGSTVRLALLGFGVPGDEIDRIEASIRSKVDLGLLGGSHAPLRVALDRNGGVHGLELELAEGHVLQACRSAQGYEVRNLQHPLRTDVEVLAITLGRDADLAVAVEAAGEEPELADAIAEALAYDVDFHTEARPHDKIDVMIEKRWLGRRFHRYGAVLAIRFRGAARKVAFYRYKPEGGEAEFFDDEGTPMRRVMRRSPVRYFGVDPEARGMLPPSIEVIEGRVGAVYRLPEGAPLLALGDGTIVAVDQTKKEGTYLDLELANGSMVRYAHLLRVIGELEPGTVIEQGQVVGLAGHSGRTPHDRLRLEIWAAPERKGEEAGGPDGANAGGEGATVSGELRTVDPMQPTAEGSARPKPVHAGIDLAQRDKFREDVLPQQRALASVRR